MIKLKSFLREDVREKMALEYLGHLIKGSEWEGLVFLAGGGVRDQLLGRDIKDIDVVVASPDGGIRFAEWLTKKLGVYKLAANPVVYPKFGTAKFNLRGAKYQGIDLSDIDIESVMTRGEKYTKGSRKPDVVFADLKDDAYRRDLTVNSLFKDLVTGEIKDLTGMGFDDLKNGIVRTPLDPDETFKDDPLRMLRTIRFAVKYNWKIPKSLIKSLIKNSDMLQNISSERIQDELNKILLTANPHLGLKLLSFTGLNRHVLPELDLCKGVTQNAFHKDDVFDHILEVVKNTPNNLIARLSAVFHDIGKPQTRTVGEDGKVHFYKHEDVGAEIAKKRMSKLRYSNEMIHSISTIVENHMTLKQAGPDGDKVSDKAIRKFVARMGNDLNVALDVIHSDNISHSEVASMPKQVGNIKNRIHSLTTNVSAKPTLPINGHDIMQHLNIQSGPVIKQLLSAVEDMWYENPQLSKDDALKLVVSKYNSSEPDLDGLTVYNPETENDILVVTAMKYEKNHPARRAAEKLLQQRRSRAK